MNEFQMDLYLPPTYFIDHQSPEIKEFIDTIITEDMPQTEQAVNLYLAVRDGWRYNPYQLDFSPVSLKASTVLHTNEAHCLGKAILLAACLRLAGIPARLHFYQVQNHLGTSRLEEYLNTNVLVFHGATEIYLNDKWVLATPAFNKGLCDKLGVDALEFDGEHDSIFQPYAREKGKFMEYLHDYGSYHDLPYEFMLREFKRVYGDVIRESSPQEDGPIRISGLDLSS